MTPPPFIAYARLVLDRWDLPDASARVELQDDELWTNYIKWCCSLAPRKPGKRFRSYLRSVKREQLSYSEWCFVEDVKQDTEFPMNNIDQIIDYLYRIDAASGTFDAVESLWIKHHLSNNNYVEKPIS